MTTETHVAENGIEYNEHGFITVEGYMELEKKYMGKKVHVYERSANPENLDIPYREGTLMGSSHYYNTSFYVLFPTAEDSKKEFTTEHVHHENIIDVETGTWPGWMP